MKRLRDLSLFEGRENIRTDEGGLLGLTGAAILAAIAGVLGISWAASVDWTYMMATMIFIVIALGVVGVIFFNVPFDRVLILSMICLAIVAFLEIGAIMALALIIAAGAFYSVPQLKGYSQTQLGMFIGLVALGVGLAVYAQHAGMIIPDLQDGLQAVVP